jgi:hypothetical protein
MTNLEEYWKKFDEIVAYNGSPITSKMMICKEMRGVTQDKKILSNIELEYDLLLLWYNLFWIFKGIHEVNISEKQEYIGKFQIEVTNFVNKHKQESSYCLQRCSVTKNQSDKLRYAFICWFLIKDPKYLLISIQLACDAITTCLDSNKKQTKDYILPCNLLSYALTLFTLYIPGDSNAKIIIKDKAIEVINDAKQNNFTRWLIEPSEILCNLLGSKEHDLASDLMKNLHQGAELLTKKKDIAIDDRITNCRIERDLLETSKLFIKFMNLSEVEKNKRRKQIHNMIAESYEREAGLRQRKGEIALVQAYCCYLPAAREYQLAGNDKKNKDNLVLFDKNNYFPPEACHEYSIKIPKFNTNLFEGENEDDIIRSISENNVIIPDEKQILEQVNKNVTKNPLSLAVTHVRLSEQGPTSKPANEEEDIKKHLVNEAMIQHIQLYEIFVCQNIKKLEESKKISKEGLTNYLSKFLILDSNTIELIKSGLSHHFNQDYIASIHILIPQLENVLRIIIRNSNVNILKEDNDAIMNKQLRGLLELQEVQQVIGHEFCKYLITKYAGINSINLRNDVSHGLLKIVDFNHTNSCAIIYGILKLLAQNQKSQTKNNEL